MIWQALLTLIPSWLANRAEIKSAEHKKVLAVINNQARLAQDENSYNHEWEMESLRSSGKGLKQVSFWLFALPILITIIFPEWGATIWANLELVPEWVRVTFLAMIGGIWGISELKRTILQKAGLKK